MARYEHLPIFRAAFDLALHMEKLVRGFSRYHKYTLGTELRNASRGIPDQIVMANGMRGCRPVRERASSSPGPGRCSTRFDRA